jgi:hypothetical protein
MLFSVLPFDNAVAKAKPFYLEYQLPTLGEVVMH